MALRDDYAAVLREQLGEGYEAATVAQMEKAFARRSLAPMVKARLKAALNATALLQARITAETTLAAEIQARKDAEALVDAQVDANLVSA